MTRFTARGLMFGTALGLSAILAGPVHSSQAQRELTPEQLTYQLEHVGKHMLDEAGNGVTFERIFTGIAQATPDRYDEDLLQFQDDNFTATYEGPGPFPGRYSSLSFPDGARGDMVSIGFEDDSGFSSGVINIHDLGRDGRIDIVSMAITKPYEDSREDVHPVERAEAIEYQIRFLRLSDDISMYERLQSRVMNMQTMIPLSSMDLNSDTMERTDLLVEPYQILFDRVVERFAELR